MTLIDSNKRTTDLELNASAGTAPSQYCVLLGLCFVSHIAPRISDTKPCLKSSGAALGVCCSAVLGAPS